MQKGGGFTCIGSFQKLTKAAAAAPPHVVPPQQRTQVIIGVLRAYVLLLCAMLQGMCMAGYFHNLTPPRM